MIRQLLCKHEIIWSSTWDYFLYVHIKKLAYTLFIIRTIGSVLQFCQGNIIFDLCFIMYYYVPVNIEPFLSPLYHQRRSVSSINSVLGTYWGILKHNLTYRIFILVEISSYKNIYICSTTKTYTYTITYEIFILVKISLCISNTHTVLLCHSSSDLVYIIYNRYKTCKRIVKSLKLYVIRLLTVGRRRGIFVYIVWKCYTKKLNYHYSCRHKHRCVYKYRTQCYLSSHFILVVCCVVLLLLCKPIGNKQTRCIGNFCSGWAQLKTRTCESLNCQCYLNPTYPTLKSSVVTHINTSNVIRTKHITLNIFHRLSVIYG